jgi:hypothetical protein
VRGDAARLGQNLAALDFVTLPPRSSAPMYVARLTSSSTCGTTRRQCRSSCGVVEADDFHFLADAHDAALDTTSHDGAPRPEMENTSSMGIRTACPSSRTRLGDVRVAGVQQFQNALGVVPRRPVALKSLRAEPRMT